MRVSIEIDEQLIQEARRLTGEPDAGKVADLVFRQFIDRQSKIQGLLDLVGKVHLADDYDYKAARAADRDRD